MNSQLYVFLIFLLNGFLIGILFDTFRALRKAIKTHDIITCIQDCIFWILSGLLVIYSTLKFNDGKLRWFIFISLLLSFSFYILAFSKYYMYVTELLIKIVKKIITFLVIIPLKYIISVIFKPTTSIMLKIYQYFTKKFLDFSKKIKK